MSKLFYYDKGTADANEVKGGDANGGTTFAPDDSKITNETLANDQSVGAALTTFSDEFALRFDFGASIDAEYVAVYFNVQETSNIDIHVGNHATNMGAAKLNYTTTFGVGWNIIDLSGTESGRYWFIVAEGGALVGLCEIMICSKWTFTNTFALGASESKMHGIDIDRSYGNVKGTNKRFDELMTWNGTWDNVTETNKTDLKTFESAIDIVRLKFIYYDGTKHWWVSKTNRFDFVLTAYNHYTLGINLIEEIE